MRRRLSYLPAARHRSGFTALQLLVVVGIFLILLVLVLSLVATANEKANRVMCRSLLRSFGQMVLLYTNENQGHFPRTTYAPGPVVIPVAGTGVAASNPFASDGPMPNDISAAIFLVLRTEDMGSETLVCPSSDAIRDNFGGSGRTALSQSNFTDYRKNLSYSFVNPYPDDAAVAAKYELKNTLIAPAFALAADLSPGLRAAPTANSPNHRGRGQNVLYGDGHVEWKDTPLVGVNQDNIYRNNRGQIMASPIDKDDSVLVPAKD